REQQEHAARDQRGPEEAALVLPVFAAEQQRELAGGMGNGVHAYVPFRVATNRSARPGVRVSPSGASCGRGTASNSITVLPKGRARSSTGLSARAASSWPASTSTSV